MTDERNPSDDVLETLRRNGLWAERFLSVLSAAGFVVLRVPQGTDLQHGDTIEPALGDTQQLWDFFASDYEQWLPSYAVRRPVPEQATKPCKPCNGYGYFGHTNPALGDRCSACGGSGVATTEGNQQ